MKQQLKETNSERLTKIIAILRQTKKIADFGNEYQAFLRYLESIENQQIKAASTKLNSR